MPVPVPATAHLLQGFMLETCEISTELVTPTGAAILTALGRQAPALPAMTISKAGYGCGTRVFTQKPNLLRVFLLEAGSARIGDAAHDEVWMLETDMDHCSGEILGHAAELLLQAGALDVSYLPLFMKKGRPGFRLSVLCTEDKKSGLIDTIIRSTRTLGVRETKVRRTIAQREEKSGELDGRIIRTKQCSYNGYSFTKPEYESLVTIAKETGKSLIDLMEEYSRSKK
jgi:uncharacterized protein (DUF111 family)